jgi:hypothetical protein
MRSIFTSSSALVFALALIATATACSSDDKTEATPAPDGGGGDAAPIPATAAKQKGRIVGAIDKFGVSGATVTIAGKSVVTNPDGTYEIEIPRNTPYSMSVAAEEHWKINEQEWIFKKDLFDRTDTSLLPTAIANILASFLPAPRDTTKGIVMVRVNPLPPCESEQGTTVSIEPAGSAKVTYFANGRPNKDQPSIVKDETFSAAFSDVDPGVTVKIIINSPLCQQVPFPVDFQDVTYTGNQKAEAGEVISYIRTFIGPKK